ncbi:MAG TPA: hypothetical protein VLZ55_00910 [Rhodanobacter sp.]|nr:hypothetical protein [Rhodanobacter sp.]
MKMITQPLILVVSVAAALALGACNKADDSASTSGMPPSAMTAPSSTAAPAPMPSATAPAGAATAGAVSVTSVDIGTSVDSTNHVTAAGSSFAPKDDIYASVITNGSGSAKLDARWTFQDGQVVNEDSKTIEASGQQATAFKINKPSGFPPGNYKVEISLNGNMVSSKDFSVK